MVYRPTARVLTVLELLQARGRMTGAALAEQLEVDVRTVRNYVQTLKDLGIPVEGERGRHGGYELRPGFKLPPLIFTADEALALTIGLLLAQQAGPATSTLGVAGAMAKVERVLPEATRGRIRAVEQTVVFGGGPPPGTPVTAAVATLSAAVQSGRRVRLRYLSARAEETERGFDPYGVVSHGGVWYTIGHCHLRRGERLFRLDRILEVEPLDATFPPPPDFDPLAAVEHAMVAVPRVWQVEVWLGTTLAEARERSGLSAAHFGAPEGDGGGILLRCGAEDLETMARYLAWIDAPLVVRNPPELRAVLGRYARRLARDAARTGI